LTHVGAARGLAHRTGGAVGTLTGLSGHHDVVDAAVVDAAARRGDVIVAADPEELTRAFTAAGGRVRLETV
jgi:hypothetical protein